MAEKDKTIHDEDSFGTRIKKDPLSLLDITNDIEQIPIGPNEIERNNSRLRKIVTKEPRPASHTAKEVVAWTASNIGLPLLAAGIKGASVANKGRKGLKAINAVDKVDNIQVAAKEAEKLAKKAVEETAKKTAEKNSKLKGKSAFKKLLGTIGKMTTEELDERVAKNKVKNIATAVKAMAKYAPGLPGDMVQRLARESGAKTLIGLLAAIKGGKLISNGIPNDKDFDKEEARQLDPRIEMNPLQKGIHFGKQLLDLDNLDPSKFPMDMVNKLLVQTNADVDMWNKEQIDSLSDAEKIKLVKDVMKGKYNGMEDVSQIMRENYIALTKDYLTNNDEE